MADKNEGEMPTDVTELQAELERARIALKEVNSESAGRRKRLEELEKAETERQQANLSEVEKLKSQLAEITATSEALSGELQVMRIRSAVMSKARELGFGNAEDAYALADLSKVEITDDGKVTGFEKSLETLAESGRLPMASDAVDGRRGTPRQRLSTPAPVEPKKTDPTGIKF